MAKKDKKLSNEEDFESVRQILAGDSSAFANIQNKYQGKIAALIRRMIKNPDDVEDLTQETFIKAYNALPKFQFGYSFSAWIYRIASNNCIDFLRKRRFHTISIDQPLGDPEDDNFFEIEDNTYIPDLDVLSNEKKQIINDAIKELPDNYREIIELRHKGEMDYKEISAKLDLPLGTVKAHLFRARKILLEALKNNAHILRDNF